MQGQMIRPVLCDNSQAHSQVEGETKWYAEGTHRAEAFPNSRRLGQWR